jgi:putative transposase
MKQIKGTSSHYAKEVLPPDSFFRWQEGYGVFSFSPSARDRIVSYIQNQKMHHAENTLIPTLETADEEI